MRSSRTRRSTIYLLVLGSAMIVTVIGVSGILAVRVRQQETSLGGDLIGARHLAAAALEVGLQEINASDTWRDDHTDGRWWSNRALGLGKVGLHARDPDDGDLTDGFCDRLVLTAYGHQGDARQALRMELVADAVGHDPHYDVVQALRPVAYWRLGEDSGTDLADTTGAFPGKYFNGALPGEPAPYTCDPCAFFDGVNDVIGIGHDDAFNVNDGAISLWFNTDWSGFTQGLFSRDAFGFGEGGHITIWLESGRVVARVQSQVDSYYVYSDSISANRWHHVCLVFGSDGLALYLDGSLQDTDSYTGGFSNEEQGWTGSAEPIGIGASSMGAADGTVGTNMPFRGHIDEVALFDTALDETDVVSLHSSGTVAPPMTMQVSGGSFVPVVD